MSEFPTGNKIKNPNALNQSKFGENMTLLEHRLNNANWGRIGSFYAIGMLTLLATIFLFIVVIRFAFIIF